MIVKIWRILAQILYDRNDLADLIKPFFLNLQNETINDEKYIPFLNTFSKYQLEALHFNEIIPKEKFYSPMNKYRRILRTLSFNDSDDNKDNQIEEIISGDKLKELQKFIQSNDFNQFKTIVKSFKEVQKMQIPLIQYCIIQNAIECFKYLLVNGFDDPKEKMIDKEPNPILINAVRRNYEWDCMATAIYLGKKEIIKILESKGITKGNDPSHIEAAILSYRNQIVEEILDEIKENNDNIINNGFFASTKNSNFKGAELLMKKGANINATDIKFPNISLSFLIKMIWKNGKKLNKNNWTPLYFATWNNSKEIGEILISKGANVTVKDINYLNIELLFFINIIYNQWKQLNKKNTTLLHYAAFTNAKEIGELLISKGANVHAKLLSHQKRTIYFLIKVNKYLTRKLYKKNNTPLHLAAEKNSVEIAELLLSKGANIDACTINYQKILLLLYLP